MSERIPVRTVETFEQLHPKKVKAKSSDNLIHTRSFTGLFRTLRLSGAGFLFLAFFGTVWLNWGGRQAVLWDLAESKFHIFGATFWPQDFILLSALLIICAFGLFAITVFAGRVWCGYTCPQSSFTWLFMWCEKVTEGERNQRIKLQAAPWSPNKLARRAAKHTLWLVISVLTGLTFVGYFTPIRPLAAELLTWQMGGVSLFWVLFFTAATYINAGWLRLIDGVFPGSRLDLATFERGVQFLLQRMAGAEQVVGMLQGAHRVLRRLRAVAAGQQLFLRNFIMAQ